ncbi:G-type lectin S-receptor-like serine/threonine-protein kinase [Thalictrum thalictroides]|uniref:G-type lectin S-receptor-like serine/threonine-protein kinase n=1 Tax=Thalictrum thalictroides TaxID=46969 RepID=A0A7J6XEJ6_THATH|nr:G-type lectin S-receptor-like serine/threonine-protein kinase [Thalictrum thalictroides]
METSFTAFLFTIISLFLGSSDFCFAVESISPNKLIRDPDSITSLNQTFRLGFFSPGNSSNRYVGIWYNSLPRGKLVIWVANRNSPLTDSLGVLRIIDDGNLVVLDGNENIVWTTNVSANANSSRAELLDSGNLVLRETSSSDDKILWQSFDNPTDTFLPNMRFGVNIKTGKKQVLTPWKTDSDPSKGRFHLELEPLVIPQLVLWEGSLRHGQSGPWDGTVFIGVEGMYSDPSIGFDRVRDEEEGNVYLTVSYRKKNLYARYAMNSLGQISENIFNVEGENQWDQAWFMPKTECDFYDKCGSFGFCNVLSKPICSCLTGYEPSSSEEWSNGNWSSGCVKQKPLRCEQNNSSSEEGKEDGFLKHERMKVPDNMVNWVRGKDLEECEQRCLKNCSCTAYSYGPKGCMWWHGNLIDMQRFNSMGGEDIYVRVAHSEFGMEAMERRQDRNAN